MSLNNRQLKCLIPSYRDEEKRKRSRKQFFDEMDTSDSDMEDTISSPRKDFKINSFLPIIDKLNTELRTRMEAYISLSNRFGFLSHLSDLSPDELRAAASNLVRHYSSDLEKELKSEIIHFSSLVKGLIDANVFKVTNSYETDLFVQLNENALNDAFPNVNILLKIYLCMFATNCKGERSFSKVEADFDFFAEHNGARAPLILSSPGNRKRSPSKYRFQRYERPVCETESAKKGYITFEMFKM